MRVDPPMGPRATGSVAANGARQVLGWLRCRSCDSVLREAKLEDGTVVLLDYAVRPEPAEGLVAVNPARGTGRMLAATDVEPARGWMAAGALIYCPHELTCIRPGGDQLELGGVAER